MRVKNKKKKLGQPTQDRLSTLVLEGPCACSGVIQKSTRLKYEPASEQLAGRGRGVTIVGP